MSNAPVVYINEQGKPPRRPEDRAREIIALMEDADILWMQAIAELVDRARQQKRYMTLEVVVRGGHLVVREVDRHPRYVKGMDIDN